MGKNKTAELDPRYHDTWRLLKKYRDVVWSISGYKMSVFSTDAPSGTIFVAENNSLLETGTEDGVTSYKVDISAHQKTSANANGVEYYGVFKVCIPVTAAADEGSFQIRCRGQVAQFQLYLADNASTWEQSYIIADPAYVTLGSSMPFKWSKTDTVPETASLQVVKVGDGGSPLEGAEFTLTGSGGTTVNGTTDRNGQVVWKDLPADESYTLDETQAPEGYQIVDTSYRKRLPGSRTSPRTCRSTPGKTQCPRNRSPRRPPPTGPMLRQLQHTPRPVPNGQTVRPVWHRAGAFDRSV